MSDLVINLGPPLLHLKHLLKELNCSIFSNTQQCDSLPILFTGFLSKYKERKRKEAALPYDNTPYRHL